MASNGEIGFLLEPDVLTKPDLNPILYSISHISANILVYLLKGQYCRNETWIDLGVVNVLLVAVYLMSSENNSTYRHVKIAGNKSEYTLSEHVITVSKVSIFCVSTIVI